MKISVEKDPEVFDALLAGEDPGTSADCVRGVRETIEDVRAEFGDEFVEQTAGGCRREREALSLVEPDSVIG